jgi:tetratricopeptide (TPR) repeat protein
VAELAELLPGLQTCLDVDGFAPLQAWTMFESAFPALAGGRWEQAADLIGRAVEFSRERGYPAYQAPFLAHLAWVERARGRYGEALRVGRRAAQIAGGTGHPWWIALTETMLGWALTEVGALAEAVERLERGLAAAERDGTEGFLVRCLAHLAWACCLRGEPERAEVLAERAETLLAGVTGGPFRHGAHATLAVATVRIGLGQPEPAHRLLEPLRDAAAGAGWVETMAWADLLLARCRLAEGRPPAAGLVAGVLAAAGRHELPGLAWQAHALLGHREAAAAIVDDLAGSLDGTGAAASYRAHAGAALDVLAGATRPQVEKGTT